MNKKNVNRHDHVTRSKRIKTPTVLQMEAAECGAASLAIVLAYYGKYVPLEELRVACGVSRDGSKASNILKAATTYKLQAKGFRKEPNSLKNMHGPMIVHWNFNHFIVLEGFKKGKAYLNDPASGPRTVSEEEFDQSFTGIVLTFEITEDFEKGGEKSSVVKALSKRLKGSRIGLSYVILVGLAMVIPGLVIPIFSKVFVDEILLGGKQTWLKALLWGMGMTALIKAILTFIQEHYLLKLETKIALSTSGKFLWHVLRLPVEFFSQRYSGDISSRMQSNDRVAQILSGQLAVTALNFVMIIFYFVLMLQYDVFLTLLAVAVATMNMLYLKFVSSKRTDQNRKLLQDRGKLLGTSMSGLQTIETLKATGSESDFFSKWAGYQAKTLNAEQEMGVSTQLLSGIPMLLSSLTDAVVLILGGYRILSGHMTVGMLVAFQGLMTSFMGPVNGLVSLGSTLQEMEGDMNRLDDVLKYPIDEQMHESVEMSGMEVEDVKLQGYVKIENLTFGYSPLDSPLIEDFNLDLKPGYRVALVGGSGSGKSTIAKLISGIYKPWSGDILFDEQKRAQIPRRIINNSLSVVDQDICMFGASIRDNITLWDQSIPEIHVINAAKDAFIHEEITARIGGYEHHLTEGGANFSGGQRQRLEIARALVTNPSILVLDEATSALDTMTEKMIDQNIRRRGCTCVIVAHRLSTIRDCDEIIVLERGKIVQRGTHDELKNIDGHYKTLIDAS